MRRWDRVHLGAGVGRGTSRSGSFIPTALGTPCPAAVYLPLPVETQQGEMEVAHVPSLGACTGN